MSGLVFASPPVAPPGADQWGRVQMTWTGWDGSTWDLRDWTSGVFVTSGVVGLHHPRIQQNRSVSRTVAGHRRRGWRVEGRDVFWPVFVFADEEGTFQDRYARFFHSIHPDHEGVWAVTVNDRTRRLRLVGRYDSEHEFARDPVENGWESFGVDLEPAQPLWEGDPETTGPLYGATATVDFLDPAGGPPIYISDAATFSRANITNPGDVKAWLRWTLEGPLTNIHIGAGGVTADVFDLEAGDTLVIDTDPRNVQALLNGANATEQLGLIEFGAVPPGEKLPLLVAADGAGMIQGDLTPLYFDAF